MAAGVADLRESLGLDRDEEARSVLEGPGISWFPRSFDLPEAPAHVRRFRDGSLPAPTPVAERSVVYVTLGTEVAGVPFFADVLPQVVRGAVQAGLPVVVATGKPVDLALLSGIEGDVRVETWVDQAEVLRTARVVVCHAGSGTVLGALGGQVPIVAVPLFADQPDNAARIAETGCGLQVPPEADQVAAATRELAAHLPEGCVRMARELAALPPAEDAVPWLEAVAERGPGGARSWGSVACSNPCDHLPHRAQTTQEPS
jgi:UDP:flavonoid glycosyltransferase YjiC (YdhE family)